MKLISYLTPEAKDVAKLIGIEQTIKLIASRPGPDRWVYIPRPITLEQNPNHHLIQLLGPKNAKTLANFYKGAQIRLNLNKVFLTEFTHRARETPKHKIRSHPAITTAFTNGNP